MNVRTRVMWRRVPVGNVVIETQYGTSKKANESGRGIPILRMNNITFEGHVDLSSLKHVELEPEETDRYTVRKGDILFNRTNSPDLVGKTTVWESAESYAVAGYLVRVRVDESKADPRFVAAWFNTPEMKAELRVRAKPSGNMANISASEVLKFQMPLPSLEEQQRVMDVLAHAEVLRKKRRDACGLRAELLRAVFERYFGPLPCSPITVGEDPGVANGWRWERLGEVATLATGHTPDRKVSTYWNGDIPWISLSDIRRLDGGEAHDTAERVTAEGIANSAAVRLPPGTVCFSRTASIGFVTTMGREMSTSQDFVNWICGPRLDPTYLMHAFIVSRGRLRALAPGSTHKTIYFPTVERFRVLVPPIELQRKFAERVRTLDSIRKGQESSSQMLDVLFASLQQRAFSGLLG